MSPKKAARNRKYLLAHWVAGLQATVWCIIRTCTQKWETSFSLLKKNSLLSFFSELYFRKLVISSTLSSLWNVYIPFKKTDLGFSQLYEPGMSFSRMWEPSPWNVNIKEDRSLISQCLWERTGLPPSCKTTSSQRWNLFSSG